MIDLIGVWEMVAFRNTAPDGTALAPSYGPEGSGLIRFLPSGRMMVVIADGRASIPPEDMERHYSSYTGIYEFDGKTLITKVDGATDLDRVGGQQIREVRYSDGLLSLIPPPIEIDGILATRELVWRRIA